MQQIHFSEQELALMHDPEVMLAKVRIIKNISTLFSKLEPSLHSIFRESRSNDPLDFVIREGKISRGENYLNLPYVILDFPRIKNGQSLFFFRTMFWWGKYFSCTLHLQGSWLSNNLSSCLESQKLLMDRGYYFCINSSPWEYHFEENNYIAFDKLQSKEIEHHASAHDFIKLSRKLELNKWQSLPDFSMQTLEELLAVFKNI